jgi:hypothetical protein
MQVSKYFWHVGLQPGFEIKDLVFDIHVLLPISITPKLGEFCIINRKLPGPIR